MVDLRPPSIMGEISRDEAPLIFLYVFLSTTAIIMLVYFISLLIFHCVFWPKILAKIKADKPRETAQQEQILRKLAVGRDIQREDKTQSERTETPSIRNPAVERTQSAEDFFRAAATVISENASLIGDKMPRSAGSVETCASTVTAAPVATPLLGVQTAKESKQKGKRWWEDDMMNTGMELLQPPPQPQQRSIDAKRQADSKDQKRKAKGLGLLVNAILPSSGITVAKDKRPQDRPENATLLRTGIEKKEGGRTNRKIRFNDDIRTCREGVPLLGASQSLEEAKRSSEEQKRSEELKKRKLRTSPGTGSKDPLPGSIYAFEEETKDQKEGPKDPKDGPKDPKNGPKDPKDGPKDPKDGPKDPVEPKEPKDEPKRKATLRKVHGTDRKVHGGTDRKVHGTDRKVHVATHSRSTEKSREQPDKGQLDLCMTQEDSPR